MRDRNQVSRHERLVDLLADDILGATDADVLATHTPDAARVVAGSQRQALRRAIAGASRTADTRPQAPLAMPVRPDHDDEERR